jgi:2-polyprenyl-3-methyl-5-hydroxy-6-metoxy-1,4-benzoquinol methylase
MQEDLEELSPPVPEFERQVPAIEHHLYLGYESWKGWTNPFTYTAEEAKYFAGETRGLRIRDADVLEIGFGSGSFLAWAREKGARVAGTEINPKMLAAARNARIEMLPSAFEVVAQIHAARFDTIIALDVFEHFSLLEIAARLKAAEIMLKPGGHLVLRFPNAQSPFGLAPQHGDPTHKSALSRGVIEQLAQGTAFEVVRYAPSFRVGGTRLVNGLVRRARYAARELITALLNAVYAENIPWDSVVVLVLRKRSGSSQTDV